MILFLGSMNQRLVPVACAVDYGSPGTPGNQRSAPRMGPYRPIYLRGSISLYLGVTLAEIVLTVS